MSKAFYIVILIFLISISNAFGQGIIGTVRDFKGEAIDFVTIFVKELETGSSTNIEGDFQMQLPSGEYNLIFQHLGYKAKELKVIVGAGLSTLEVNLEPEIILLQNVVIVGNNEDPAYTIMRKAISKAKYHKQQVNSFEVEAYIKGSGRLLDSPFFLRKMIEKEGVDSTSSFTSETVSKIKFERPNTYEEEVVSIRSNGEDYGTNPNSFIMGSFYDPLYADAISPLSPRAFGYYKFEYLGTKRERGYDISKIKVTPRSKGDNVFWGEISIVEDEWSIKSTNLYMQNAGILFNIKQIFEPIESSVWLPISHKFDVTGKVFGFEFKYEYLSTMGKYSIEINKDLPKNVEVVDEKIDKKLAGDLKNKSVDEINQALAQGKEVTRKQFRKLISEYEKEEVKSEDDPLVESNYSLKIDSLASNSDSSYWAVIRPVPLTSYEVKGYHKTDSVFIAEKKEAEGDTLVTNKHEGFRPFDIILGYNFKLSEKDRLQYFAPWQSLNFNTVEGYNFSIKLKYTHNFINKSKLFVWPEAKFGFASAKLYGKVHTEFRYGPLYRRSSVWVNGGYFSKQLNNLNPIHPFINSITTLLLHENYMKLYESTYITASNVGFISDRLSYNVSMNVEKRASLQNRTTHSWLNSNIEYSTNAPINLELTSTDFTINSSFIYSLGFEYSPWLKYKIKNEIKSVINSSSPIFNITYKSGVPVSVYDGADFKHLEVGFKQNLKIGIRGEFFIDARAGTFIATSPNIFTDFKHFSGNETPFLMEDPVGSYRLLPYYLNSTKDKYISTQVLYKFRKFLFTQLPVLQLTGVKELSYLSYLSTPTSGNYVELGYGLDNLFRFLRIEAVTSFTNGTFNGFGVKVGVSTNFSSGDGEFNVGF